MERQGKYVIRLDEAERGRLQALVDQGNGSKTTRKRAWILLKADEGEHARRGPTRRSPRRSRRARGRSSEPAGC